MCNLLRSATPVFCNEAHGPRSPVSNSAALLKIANRRQRQQPFLLVAEQLLIRDDPGRIRAPTALAFRGADSTQAAPLPHREFRLTQQASQLLGRVPFLRSLPLDQQRE